MEIVFNMLGELTPCGGGDQIPLLGMKLLVGRRSSCDICLRFPNVSSHHCELELRSGYWHVKDLGSSNGIKVNGEKCLTKCLMPGDVLQVAKHRFRIDYSASGVTPPPEEENPFAMSLMEKAGLGSSQPRSSDQSSSQRKSKRVSQGQRGSSEDDFLMDWLSDE